MSNTYADYMNELTPDVLYEGLLGHGLFCEKLPPIISSEAFFNYCATLTTPFEDKPKQYISYSSMRNINVPRQFGIPNPFAYQKLCRCLSDNWGALKQHFVQKTQNQPHKVSRIHVRKLSNTKSLFKMSYKNWRIDDSPEADVLIGSRYVVKADIATCFPSVYSHSIAWALAGKDVAKRKRKPVEWFNCIDHFSQQIKDGETHGLLIGPHASNLLSEIILTCVDYELVQRKWKFIRNVDDYSCYVSTYEDAQMFLVELNKQLRHYDLLLNPKKTEILELPIAAAKQWVRQIEYANNLQKSDRMDYKEVRASIDSAIELMQSNDINAAILNYTVKVLLNKKMTDNARQYCLKSFLHLALIYPYLVPLLEENVFRPHKASKEDIAGFAEKLFAESMKQQNYEAAYYAIYYATKWDFLLTGLTAEISIDTQDCLVMLFAHKYFEKNADRSSTKKLKAHAKLLRASDFDSNWLFVYETLPKSELSGAWKPMKAAGITFLTI